MKTTRRTIGVGDQAFVYWHAGGARFTPYLSPKEQKNTKPVLVFPAFPPGHFRKSRHGKPLWKREF